MVFFTAGKCQIVSYPKDFSVEELLSEDALCMSPS